MASGQPGSKRMPCVRSVSPRSIPDSPIATSTPTTSHLSVQNHFTFCSSRSWSPASAADRLGVGRCGRLVVQRQAIAGPGWIGCFCGRLHRYCRSGRGGNGEKERPRHRCSRYLPCLRVSPAPFLPLSLFSAQSTHHVVPPLSSRGNWPRPCLATAASICAISRSL